MGKRVFLRRGSNLARSYYESPTRPTLDLERKECFLEKDTAHPPQTPVLYVIEDVESDSEIKFGERLQKIFSMRLFRCFFSAVKIFQSENFSKVIYSSSTHQGASFDL